MNESLADAIDNARTEQKDRALDARCHQAIPTLPDIVTPAHIVAVELFRLFDSLPLFGYSQITLFESDAPGATAALTAWAEANGIVPTVEIISDGITQVTSVQAKYPGPVIHVQRKIEAALCADCTAVVGVLRRDGFMRSAGERGQFCANGHRWKVQP